MPIEPVGWSSVLLERSPIVGVPGEARSASYALSSLLHDVDTGLFQTGQAVTALSQLSSRTVQSIVDRIESGMLLGALRLSDDLSIASWALARYADEIEMIHASARQMIDEVEQLLTQILTCSYELDSAAATFGVSGAVPSHWQQAPSVWPPASPVHTLGLELANAAAQARAAGSWFMHARSWACALDEINACQHQWRALITRRYESEQQLSAKLRGTSIAAFLRISGASQRVLITKNYTDAPVHQSRWRADARLQGIVSGRFSPREVRVAWHELNVQDKEISQLPIETIFGLASADGLPFRVRDIASRLALEYARDHPRHAHRMMGLQFDVSLSTFTQQVQSLHREYHEAAAISAALGRKPEMQLLGFGVHDGALTASFSLGNAERATHIGVNVLGMGSDVEDVDVAFAAARELYLQTIAHNEEADAAVITWLGYHSPTMPPSIEVVHSARAAAGAAPLAEFIDAITVARAGDDTELQRLAVFAHSYGSTTSAEALKFTDTRVDTFVTYGSAGLVRGTTLDQIRADQVFATRAAGDDVAGLGVFLSSRTDPRDIDGVIEFSSDKSPEGTGVTSHDLFTEGAQPTLLNLKGKVGYMSPETSAVKSMGKILAGSER